jgi:Protein of unknown function (DUF3467)
MLLLASFGRHQICSSESPSSAARSRGHISSISFSREKDRNFVVNSLVASIKSQLTNSPRVIHTKSMTQPPGQTKVQLANTQDYRERYANSVQMRVSLWDFLLLFGTINQTAPDQVTIQNFQGVYLSPPQAKALSNLLQQNLKQYEAAFGEIRLEAQAPGEIIQ